MTLFNGYEMKSTFLEDFAIANMFGEKAVKDTFSRAFKEWKNNYIYLTELVVALNFHLWDQFGKGNQIAKLYDELWRKADEFAMDNLKGEELQFFLEVTD